METWPIRLLAKLEWKATWAWLIWFPSLSLDIWRRTFERDQTFVACLHLSHIAKQVIRSIPSTFWVSNYSLNFIFARLLFQKSVTSLIRSPLENFVADPVCAMSGWGPHQLTRFHLPTISLQELIWSIHLKISVRSEVHLNSFGWNPYHRTAYLQPWTV